MSGLLAEEGSGSDAVAHLADARTQNSGAGILGEVSTSYACQGFPGKRFRFLDIFFLFKKYSWNMRKKYLDLHNLKGFSIIKISDFFKRDSEWRREKCRKEEIYCHFDRI